MVAVEDNRLCHEPAHEHCVLHHFKDVVKSAGFQNKLLWEFWLHDLNFNWYGRVNTLHTLVGSIFAKSLKKNERTCSLP